MSSADSDSIAALGFVNGDSLLEQQGGKDAVTKPEFPGGTEALREYFQKNIACIKSMGTGEESACEDADDLVAPSKLFLGIDSTGKVSEAGFETDSLDKKYGDCIKVLAKMPLWVPASKKGKNTSGSVVLYVNFRR